ncbi:hypothetical protein QOZ80_2BG0164790 [Eleusine coracana subsp. coracana]|nr:hypothetical protein QOZ80_2BG0164790 [Eleusine coracana subsp. coracana]
MDFTVLPPPLGPPRRAGGDRTPPARALRASLNPACVSRPSAAVTAAAQKPKLPGLSGDEDPKTKRLDADVDGKENKNAPTSTAAKVRIVLRPSSRVGEAPTKLPLGNTTTRLSGAAAANGHAVGANPSLIPAAMRKATPADSEIALLRPCSRGDGASRSALGNTTAHLRVGAAAEGHAVGASTAPALVAKRKATTPADSKIAVLRACSRGEGASRLPLGNTARTRVGAAAEASTASPSPPSSDSGGTVRELLETARTITDAIRRREIERLRAASRRELDRVVRTVEFNDPFISPQDVLR